MKHLLPALAKRSLALALALAILLSLCPVIPLTAEAAPADSVSHGYVAGNTDAVSNGLNKILGPNWYKTGNHCVYPIPANNKLALALADHATFTNPDNGFNGNVTIAVEYKSSVGSFSITDNFSVYYATADGFTPVTHTSQTTNSSAGTVTREYTVSNATLKATGNGVENGAVVITHSVTGSYAAIRSVTITKVANETPDPDETNSAPEFNYNDSNTVYDSAALPALTIENPNAAAMAATITATIKKDDVALENATFVKENETIAANSTIDLISKDDMNRVITEAGQYKIVLSGTATVDGTDHTIDKTLTVTRTATIDHKLQEVNGDLHYGAKMIADASVAPDVFNVIIKDANGNEKVNKIFTSTQWEYGPGDYKTANLTETYMSEFLPGTYTVTVQTGKKNGNSISLRCSTTTTYTIPEPEPVNSASAMVELKDGAANIVATNVEVAGVNTTDGSTVTLNTTANENYAYWEILAGSALAFKLDRAYMNGFNLTGEASVTVEYYDIGTGSAELIYHSTDSNQAAPDATITTNGEDTYALKTVTFPLFDAAFKVTDNTDVYGWNAGYAFVIESLSGTVMVKSVTVTTSAVTYTAELNSSTAPALNFYDDAEMDLALSVKTDGTDEEVTVTYTLSGGDLAEDVTETKNVTLTATGTGILGGAWFNEKVIGYGNYTLKVVVTKLDGTEVINKDFTFSRDKAYTMDLVSESGKTEFVYIEDEAYDLSLQLQKQYGESKELTLEYIINDGEPNYKTVTVSFGEVTSVSLELPAGFGSNNVVYNLKDGDTLLITKTYTVERKMSTPIISDFRSENAENTTLEYKDNAAYDLKLYLKHRVSDAANYAVIYTISKNGVALDGLKDQVAKIASLTETEMAVALKLPAVNQFGQFTLHYDIKDDDGNVVHSRDYTFSRYLVDFTNTTLTSETANAGLVFVDDAAYDLKLSVQKADGNDEELAISYVVVNTAAPSTAIKAGSFDKQVYSGTTPTALDLSAILADVTAIGTYELKLTVTDSRGCVQTINHTFSRIESIKVDLVSDGNAGAGMIFPEDKEYDLSLSLQKQAGEDIVYNVMYLVVMGETTYAGDVFENITISSTPTKLPLNLTHVNGTGKFTIIVSFMDAEGVSVKNYSFTTGRVPAMDVEFTAEGAEEITENGVTFIDYVPYNITINAKKHHQAEAENMTIEYVLTDDNGNAIKVKDADGNEITITGTKTLPIGSDEKVSFPVDLSQLEDLNTKCTYTLKVTIRDSYGNVAKTVDFTVARKDTVRVELQSKVGDLVYTDKDGAFDLTLYIGNYSGNAERFTMSYTIYDPDGNKIPLSTADDGTEIYTNVGSANIAASNYIKQVLTEYLSSYTEKLGTYKVEVTVTDSSDNIREEVTIEFYRITAENSVTIQLGKYGYDLIYTTQDTIDPMLAVTKTAAVNVIEKNMYAILTITDEAGKDVIRDNVYNKITYTDANGIKHNGLKAPLNNLTETRNYPLSNFIDFTEFTKIGTYTAKIIVVDDSNNVRGELTKVFKIVGFNTVITGLTSNTNDDKIFTNEDVLDLSVHVQKTDDVPEGFKSVNVTITDKDGAVLAQFASSLNERLNTKVDLANYMDLSGIKNIGTYNVNVTVIDDVDNVRCQETHQFHIIDANTVESALTSSSNPDKVFVGDEPVDLTLHLKKTDGFKESFKNALITITDENGTVLAQYENHLPAFTTFRVNLANYMDLSGITKVGNYNVNVTLTDDAGKVRHTASHLFAIAALENSISSDITSPSNPDRIFTTTDAIDLTLQMLKNDKVKEGFTALLTVTDKDDKELVKFEDKLNAFTSAKLKLANFIDFSPITEVGAYDVNLTLTDDKGTVRHTVSKPIYVVNKDGSVISGLTSSSNPDNIFVGDEPIDLTLHLEKNDNIKEGFKHALITITDKDGKVLAQYESAKGLQAFTSTKVKLASLMDLSGITEVGAYSVKVTLTDDAGNLRHNVSHPFAIVNLEGSVDSVITSTSNPDNVFVGDEPIDLTLHLKKNDNIKEGFKYALITITDKDGKVLAQYESARGLNAFTTTKVDLASLMDLSGITKVGDYNVNVTLTDDTDNVRHKVSHRFAIAALENSVSSAITSSSNPDLIFANCDDIDLTLHLKKDDDVKEGFHVLLSVTDKEGKELVKFENKLNAFTSAKLNLANYIDFSPITKVGTYSVNLTLTDDTGNVRHTATTPIFVVEANGSLMSAITSNSHSNLIFTGKDPIDLTLHVKKTDGIKEAFKVLLTITDANNKELAKFDGKLNPVTSAKIALAEYIDFSGITQVGTYNVNVTLIDDAGNTRYQATTSFAITTVEGSVDSAITSSSNSDLIFSEGEEFDLVLHLRKNDNIAESFNITISIADNDGNELKKFESRVNAFTQAKANIADLLDLTDLPATGIFKLSVVLKDMAGDERLSTSTLFARVANASVMTQISSNTNKDMIFTDKDTVDLNLYVQKTDGIDETLHIKYTVTSPSGAVIATKEGNVKALSGSKYFKATLDNLPELTEHGTYKIHLVITDNSGIVRSESVTQLARISGTGIKHQISSSSGTNLQFSANKPFDMCLFLQKTDGVKESFQGQVYVTDPYGNVIFSIKGKINVPASGYFKFPLDLSKGTAFGTYKASYTLHDDAGTLRASGTTYFSRFSDDAVRAAVQSASGKFPGLIYGKDDAFDLALYLQKTDGLEQMLQVRYTITDMNGLVLETKQGRLTVPATGYRKIPIELPDIEALQKFGIYTFKLEVANTDGKIIFTEDYSFSRVLVPEEQLDILGVCTHLSKRGMTTKQAQQYVDLARQAGVKFWRDELPWSTVEPAKGQYKIPASADAAVDYTLSIGMEPLFILDYGNDLYGSDVTTDEWLEGYLGYVKAMVTHFKGRIMYYEVWNEWNIGLGGMDKKYREMADIYANLLIETYKVIKEIDPKVTVIGGVVAGGELKWTENMLKYPEVINAMDAFSFHCYPDNDIKEIQDQVEKLRELFKEYGREDIPMWLTETGWPTHIGRDGFTEEVSAGNLVSLYTWAIANPGVLDRIFWYDLHNDGEEAEYLEHNLGLLRNWDADVETVPMAAKKSYVAMNAMNAILLGAEYVGTYDMGHKAITAHRFNKDGKDLLVVWADDCTLNMVATIGNSNMVVTDMYGNANALTPVNGKVTLFLSDAPVYIEYDLDDTLELKEGGFKLDKAMYSATPAATFPLQITRNSGLETFEGTYAFSMPEGWSVEGVEFGAAKEGATEITDTVYVTVGDDASKGETSISVRVISNGNVMGQFSVPIEMGDICTVNPDVVFTDDGHEFKLSVQVINENSTKPLTGTINLLAPAALIGNTKASVPFEIPAGENKAVLIDVPAEMANTFHTAKVEVVLESGAKHTVTKPVSFLYAIEAPEDMKLDGVIDEQWADAMEFTVGEKNWENDNSSDIDWPGNTAKGYVMWDNEYLYVAVEAYDESHYQTATGTSIWLGDSIQMAIDVSRFTVPGYTGYNEIGFSLNSETGAIENWNWYAAPGENVSEGGIFKIVRDEDACTTTYEVALPWSEQLPAGEELNLNSVGFSLIVNENSLDEDGDPTGRTGWIEYMSGIGRRKDPTVFGDLILAKRPTE